MTKTEIISVDRVIRATPDKIFDLLADPRQHHLFDGSGSVRNAHDSAPDRLSLGAKFGMDMKIGVPYKITNEVVEFIESKQIAWRNFGGNIWRYILEPTADGTKVTEQFDYQHGRSKLMLKVMRFLPKNEKSMRKTLENLEAHFAGQ